MVYGKPPRSRVPTGTEQGSSWGTLTGLADAASMATGIRKPPLPELPTLTFPGMKWGVGLKDAHERGAGGLGLESRQQVEEVLDDAKRQLESQTQWLLEATGFSGAEGGRARGDAGGEPGGDRGEIAR